MSKVKNLIVGCGFSGATLARKIVQERKEKVVIIDIKDHIAGNCYDYRDNNGICIHKYGTHIFHTNLKSVWDFVSRFTKWYPYQHKVKGLVDGQLVPIPFNLNSLHQVFPKSLANKIELCLLEKFGFNKKVPILELRKTNDKDLTFLAEYIYQKIFLEYTLKQWGMKPEDMAPAVSGRVPIYISRDDRYFQDKYQGIPIEGYTALVLKMLDHPNIKIKLSTVFSKEMEYERLFYSGPIDEFFEYKLGELPYRSIMLDFLEFPYSKFQEAAVINYPCNYDFTRIGEHKWFLNSKSDKTVVSYEYPEEFKIGKNERYYPIVKEESQTLYNKYLELAKGTPNIYFLGRLGDYKYYDMDKAVERAFNLFEEI
ncbi:MAG: UDP-galactopyranose mutase [Endomicrobium sp.]|jgi:UDP-galactopyranose mutase|nr:UDP-galactopyranose mutase [Endomicrobium sp.]